MRHAYHLLDVFTDRPFGGNPVAVFPDAVRLPERAMRAIAAELNRSETVFVLPPEAGGTARLRIFTPKMELPFAGHPTIGTAVLLAMLRASVAERSSNAMELVLEEGSGPVPVTVSITDGMPVAARLTAPRLPEFGPEAPSHAELSALLGLEERDILDGTWRPRAASAGVPYLFVPVRDRAVLGRATVDLSVWRRTIAMSWAPHLYVITPDVEREGSSVRARMFAPAMGIVEDPATGAAAAALAGYLASIATRRDGSLRWVIEQGFEMGRPSILEVDADLSDGKPTRVQVGGRAVIVGDGALEVPDDLR